LRDSSRCSRSIAPYHRESAPPPAGASNSPASRGLGPAQLCENPAICGFCRAGIVSQLHATSALLVRVVSGSGGAVRSGRRRHVLMIHFTKTPRQPRAHFFRIIIERPIAAFVGNASLLVDHIQTFRPRRVRVVRRVVHLIDPEWHGVLKSLRK